MIKPAIKTTSGKIVVSKGKKDHHKDIPAKGEHGFVNRGEYMGRKEAAKEAKIPGVKRLHSHNLPGRKK